MNDRIIGQSHCHILEGKKNVTIKAKGQWSRAGQFYKSKGKFNLSLDASRCYMMLTRQIFSLLEAGHVSSGRVAISPNSII